MKRTILLVAIVALGACNQSTPEADKAAPEPTTTEPTTVNPAEAGFEAVAPGNYDIVRADGTIDKLTVHPGMTWSMVPAKGEPSGGTIFAQGGKNCFVTEGVEGHRCFSGTTPAADGSMTVTGDDGETATVRPSKT